MSNIDALVTDLYEELSDLKLGPLSDTPYVDSELEADGSMSLFLSALYSFPDSSIDLVQLANWIDDRIEAAKACLAELPGSSDLE